MHAGASWQIAALIEPAIEESLRFNTSAQRFKRTVMREAELHGQSDAGRRQGRAGLWLRQPRLAQIPRSRTSTTSIADPQGHLGFGVGKHFCLGSQMARLVTAMSRCSASSRACRITI